MATGSNKSAKNISPFIEPTLHVSDDSFSTASAINYHLSLLVELNRFSLTVFDATKNQYVLLDDYRFPPLNNYKKLSEQILSLSKDSEVLQTNYKSVSAAVVAKRSTLIPNPLYDEKHRHEYFAFNYETEASVRLAADLLREADAQSIYELPEAVEESLKKTFPKISIAHYSTALIEGLLILNKNQTEKKVYAHIQPEHLEIVVLEGAKLIFYNSFKCETKEDIAYYLLFVCEQLKLNPDRLQFFLLGEVQESSEVFALLKSYIRNIQFGNRPENFGYSRKFDEIPGHYYFILFSQYLV